MLYDIYIRRANGPRGVLDPEQRFISATSYQYPVICSRYCLQYLLGGPKTAGTVDGDTLSMRLGAPRDPPDAPKEVHDDPMGAHDDAKGLIKGLHTSHTVLMVPQYPPLGVPEMAPVAPRTPPSIKRQQKPMVFQCFSIRQIALPRYLPSATGTPWDASLLPKAVPGPLSGTPRRTQGPPRTSSRSPMELL